MKPQDGIGKRFSPYKKFRRVSVMPNTLSRYKGLSLGAKIVWARLAQFAGADGRAYPAVSTLAQEVGLKKRQTQNLLAELRTKGFIESDPGPRTNTYYFLLHPALIEKGVQDDASRDAESCPSPMQNDAPKETKEENQRKETTKENPGCRLSFSDLSEEKRRYIDLKVEFELARDNIYLSAGAYKAELVKRDYEGTLDISGLGRLEAWKRGDSLIPCKRGKIDPATIERVAIYQKADSRDSEEICNILKKMEKDGDENSFWGLPLHEVLIGMKKLFPDSW